MAIFGETAHEGHPDAGGCDNHQAQDDAAFDGTIAQLSAAFDLNAVNSSDAAASREARLATAATSMFARWRGEAMVLRDGLRSRLAGLADDAVRLDTMWVQACGEAQEDALVRAEETVKPILQAKCLFTLAELTAPDFSFDAAAARIRIPPRQIRACSRAP